MKKTFNCNEVTTHIVFINFWMNKLDEILLLKVTCQKVSDRNLQCTFLHWVYIGKVCVNSHKAKKKFVMLPSPDQNLKIGSVGRFFFFFFFTYHERVEFSNIFLKVSKWGKLGRNAVKTHTSAFLSHWIQILANSSPKIWHKKKTNKKNPTLFFRILRSVGRGQHNNFFFGLSSTSQIMILGGLFKITDMYTQEISSGLERFVTENAFRLWFK